MTYITENTIGKLQKLYSPPRNLRAGNKLPALFLKEHLCTAKLSAACIIFIERPAQPLLENEIFEASYLY